MMRATRVKASASPRTTRRRTGAGWVKLTGSVIFITALVLMLSETTYLADNKYANIARWSLLALLSLLYLLRPSWRLPRRKPAAFDAFCLVFLTLAAASTLYSIAPSLTLLRTATVALLYVVAFWTAWHYANAVGEERLTDMLIAPASLVFLAGIAYWILAGVGTFTTSNAAWSGGRFRGILANPNAVGMMGILFLPLVVSRYMRRRRPVDLVLLTLIGGSVVLSGSRNGVLTASISVLYLVLRSKAWKAGFVIAGLTTILYLSMTTYFSFEDVAVTPGIARLAPSDDLYAGGGRVEAWQVAIPIIRQNLLLGRGFGTEELIFRGMKFRQHVGAYVHNSYLGLAYQLGLIGASLLFLPLFGLFIGRQFRRNRTTLRIVGYEAVLLGGIAAAFLESWIYSVGNAFAFPFWICVMLLLRSSRVPPPHPVPLQAFRPVMSRYPAGFRPPRIGPARPPREPAIRCFDPPPPNTNGR